MTRSINSLMSRRQLAFPRVDVGSVSRHRMLAILQAIHSSSGSRRTLAQVSLGISCKRMSGLAMVPRSSVMTPMSMTCHDLGRS